MRRRLVVRQAVARGACGAAVGEIVEQGRSREVHADLELRKVHALSLPGDVARFEGRQDRERAVQPGLVVVVGKPDPDVLASRDAGQVGEPGQGVDGRGVGDEVGPRPVAAHAGHLHVDDPRVVLAHRVVADAPTVEHADREVVDDHVRGSAQPPAERSRFLVRHVQGQRALVAVPHQVIGRFGPVRAAAGDGVDLHHVGADVREHPGGERSRQDVAEVEDPHAVEGLHASPSQPISSRTASVSLPAAPWGPRAQGVSLNR